MSADQAARGRTIEAHRHQSTLALVRIALATGLLGALFGAALAWFTAPHDDRVLATSYIQTQAVQHIRSIVIPGASAQATESGFSRIAPDRAAATRLAIRVGVAGSVCSILLAAGLTALRRRHWIKTAEAAALDQVLAGARIATPPQLAAMIPPAAAGGVPLLIGGVPIPAKDWNRHFLLCGTTGTGKTSCLRGIIRQLIDRGEHLALFDPDGSYTERFFDPARGDLILNVWDRRSARWNPLIDIATIADASRIAAVLLPKPSTASEAAIWYNEGRALLALILFQQASNGGSLDDLVAMLNGATIESLRPLVGGTAAALIFSEKAERATASVLFMMAVAARTLATLAAVSNDAEAFSFDRFYAALDERPGPKPLIFLSCPRRYREAGTPVVTCWIDAVAAAILQRQPEEESNVWLIIDELPVLPPIQSLNTLLPEARKYHASVVLSFQSVAQLHTVYGESATHVLTGQAATQLWMQAGDTLTARWAVDMIGQTEVEVTRPTASIDTEAKGERGSLAVSRERKSLIVDAQVTGLRIGEGFLRLSGYPVAQVRIAFAGDDPIIAEAFVPAPEATAKAVLAQQIPVPSPPRIEDQDGWMSSLGGF